MINDDSSFRPAPIGVFDSGVGGLTVVAALRKALPSERILYLGDTARVPYGGKSAETVTRYSREISQLLLAEGAGLLVVACNTASALAVPELSATSPVPMIGVLEPGAAAAVHASKSGSIGVIGTRATVASDAYGKAIRRLDPGARVIAGSCPLLVPLIEEGLLEDPVTDAILERYLSPLLREGIDTLVLGCTHYPLLKPAIARICGPDVTLVDSAENCALAVAALRTRNTSGAVGAAPPPDILLTDPSEGFLREAARMLGLPIGSVTLSRVGG